MSSNAAANTGRGLLPNPVVGTRWPIGGDGNSSSGSSSSSYTIAGAGNDGKTDLAPALTLLRGQYEELMVVKRVLDARVFELQQQVHHQTDKASQEASRVEKAERNKQRVEQELQRVETDLQVTFTPSPTPSHKTPYHRKTLSHSLSIPSQTPSLTLTPCRCLVSVSISPCSCC